MKKVTLKDIAQELNVTIGTVSHVMNGRDDISEETREKVLKTAKKLGYIPNASATSLRSGKSKTIAQMIMCCLLIVHLDWFIFPVLEVIFIWASFVLTVVSLVDYVVKNRKILSFK